MQVVQEFCEKFATKLHVGENDEHLQAMKNNNNIVHIHTA